MLLLDLTAHAHTQGHAFRHRIHVACGCCNFHQLIEPCHCTLTINEQTPRCAASLNAVSWTGLRALKTHRRLPRAAQSVSTSTVSICRDVQYGKAERTVMDVYIPATVAQPSHAHTRRMADSHTEGNAVHTNNVNAQAERRTLPVALFCHGGVWATGDNCHVCCYSHLLAPVSGLQHAEVGTCKTRVCSCCCLYTQSCAQLPIGCLAE